MLERRKDDYLCEVAIWWAHVGVAQVGCQWANGIELLVPFSVDTQITSTYIYVYTSTLQRYTYLYNALVYIYRQQFDRLHF